LFIWTILRYTVGYHRNEVAFSLRELEKLTNIKHPNLWKAIKSLQERNIIYVKNNSKRKQRSIYGLNNLDEWKTNCDAIDNSNCDAIDNTCDAIDNTCDAIDNSNCDAIDNTCDAIDNSLPKELNYSNNKTKKKKSIKEKENKIKEKEKPEHSPKGECLSTPSELTSPTQNKNIIEPVPKDEILELYHKYCKELPQVRKLSPTDEKHLRARWKENDSLEFWEEFFKKVASSDFLTGKNDRGWRANFHWLIRPSNFVKVCNDVYDNEYCRRDRTKRGLNLKNFVNKMKNKEVHQFVGFGKEEEGKDSEKQKKKNKYKFQSNYKFGKSITVEDILKEEENSKPANSEKKFSYIQEPYEYTESKEIGISKQPQNQIEEQSKKQTEEQVKNKEYAKKLVNRIIQKLWSVGNVLAGDLEIDSNSTVFVEKIYRLVNKIGRKETRKLINKLTNDTNFLKNVNYEYEFLKKLKELEEVKLQEEG